MGKVQRPKPTPLRCCAAVGIAAAAGTIMFLALHNPVFAAVVGVLGAVAFLLAGSPAESSDAAPAAEPARAAVPAQRTEPIAAPQPVAVAAVSAPLSPLTDPLDQVSLLSTYVHEESGGYQPSYAPEAPTLVSRVPGQTLTLTESDSLASAFASAPAEDSAQPSAVGSWRMGIDILPQSRSSAVAVGNRLGSFRSAVVKARREAKPKPAPGRHRAS